MPAVDPSLLKPGRCILYRPSDLVGVIISLKTWSWTAHIEVVVSPTTSVAARLEGVDEYPIRNDKYVCGVLEPKEHFDIDAAMAWFRKSAKGDKYFVSGLFGFYLPKEESCGAYHHEFCSMLADMFYHAGGVKLFADKWPASKVAPAQFLQTPGLNQVYPQC